MNTVYTVFHVGREPVQVRSHRVVSGRYSFSVYLGFLTDPAPWLDYSCLFIADRQLLSLLLVFSFSQLWSHSTFLCSSNKSLLKNVFSVFHTERSASLLQNKQFSFWFRQLRIVGSNLICTQDCFRALVQNVFYKSLEILFFKFFSGRRRMLKTCACC